MTGEPLEQRIDDRSEIVRRRLDDYVVKTRSVIDYYKKQKIFHEFVGTTTDDLWPSIEICLNNIFYLSVLKK